MILDSMRYHLLTGATGLLGGYLLKDLQNAGLLLAVVVRPARRNSARQRIENLMERWEKQAGYALPRPVVLVGDLTQPNLGLGPEDLAWVRDHCGAVVHNAASLKFVGPDREGEPWVSNLQGTQHVLDLCRTLGIQRLFHVSTAYVCGQRTGRILESETDVGQTAANDYEASKLAAELVVRRADFLTQRIIFRPAIIAGDSRTGFTSAFHGFYFPLKVAAALEGRGRGAQGLDLPSLFRAHGLTGQERKNFVPVDWVSAVMTQIIGGTSRTEATYHLTSDQPVPLHRMAEVIAAAIGDPPRDEPARATEEVSTESNVKDFRMLMTAYQSYWRDDPQFCAQNTKAAVPHLPCPEIDDAMMRRWCQYALRVNFQDSMNTVSSKVSHAPSRKHTQCDAVTPERTAERLAADVDTNSLANRAVHVQVNGPGGGQWQFDWDQCSIRNLRRGIDGHEAIRVYLNSHTLERLRSQQLSAATAIAAGAVLIEGSAIDAAKLLTQIVDTFQSLELNAVEASV